MHRKRGMEMSGTKLKINITECDIAEGIRANYQQCPVARALKREIADCEGVYSHIHFLNKPDIETPVKAYEWIERYDKGKKVKPFSFTITI